MRDHAAGLPEILAHSPVQVVFGEGRLCELGELARAHRAKRLMLVTDPGVKAAGHAERAVASLEASDLSVVLFDGVARNPTTAHVRAGVSVARGEGIDFFVAVGGGSAMDCAKGINLILTRGGEIADHRGAKIGTEPMLPLIAVPTTAGTGSEAQSFALIRDEHTHEKMACGDTRLPHDGGLRPRVAILDPLLTLTQPPDVAATAGIDAIAHAVETAACTRRNEVSQAFSVEAWSYLRPAYERVVRDPTDRQARANMLIGAHLAGAAIELSMLGAAHACANPLTARCGITHGHAVGMMLPHVIRLNGKSGRN
ncbi:MAG: iron-containing alcohol dehydrogenase, partial [Planctomycetes bacterium]|nr:iron-containing alcohol dehydrogenase [Planctomycetota bacterium]